MLRQLTTRVTRLTLSLLLIGLAPDFGQSAETGEWPQFLGPHRNGISEEKNLLESWPAGGPREVWRAKGGVGMAGLAVSRGRLVTLVQTEGQQRLLALDANTGKPLWQTPIAPAYTNSM